SNVEFLPFSSDRTIHDPLPARYGKRVEARVGGCDHVRLGMGLGNTMKREISNVPAQRPFARHRLGMLGLALTLALFAMVGEAQAQCTPNSPVSNSTVVCSGAVTNPGTGYGSFADTGNTYTVSGTLTGGNFGLQTGG